MNFQEIPDLREICSHKIIALFFNHKNVIRSFVEFGTAEERKERIKAKIELLQIPTDLKVSLISLIMDVDNLIMMWRNEVRTRSIRTHMPNKLYWGFMLTLDQKKLAQSLTKKEDFDILMRYKLACKYYLLEEMNILWRNLPVRSEDLFPYPPGMAKMGNWTSPPDTGEKLIMYDSYEEAFKSQALHGTIVGTRLFLNKVDPVRRKNLIFETAKSAALTPDTETFVFLLSNLDTEEQTEVLRSQNQRFLLIDFLTWPFTRYFLKVLDQVFDLLTDFQISAIVKHILYKINNGHSEWYQQALSKLLKMLKRDTKISVLESNIFDVREIHVVTIIFDSLNEEEKELFMESYDLEEYFYYLIKHSKWTLFKCFMEYGFTEDKRLEFLMGFEIRFRNDVDKHLLDVKSKEWNEVFPTKKRNIDLGESSSPTKFQKFDKKFQALFDRAFP